MRQLGMVSLILFFLAVGTSLPAQEKGKNAIIGRYDWHNGNIVVIRPDGTASSGDTQGGRWVINPYGGSGYVIMWEGGFVESLKLKGTKLEGTGLDSDGKAYTVSGTRKK